MGSINDTGKYTGDERVPEADVLFASNQTLSRRGHLRNFPRDAFDYIVVDEFHHAAAATYRRLIDHFTPRFLLGLTATPERTDGGDLLALCQENLVYRCDLFDGIRRGYLSAFHYFGVPDNVDYEQIPWRSTRFDEEALTAAWQGRAGSRWRAPRGARSRLAVSSWHRGRRRRGFRFSPWTESGWSPPTRSSRWPNCRPAWLSWEAA